RADVLAAAADDVALAIDEVEPAVRVDEAQIAGVEPAVAKRLRRLLGILVVGGHHGGRLDEDLADLAGWERRPRVVHHPDLDAGHGRPARAGARRRAEWLDRDHARVGRA